MEKNAGERLMLHSIIILPWPHIEPRSGGLILARPFKAGD